MIMIIYSKWLLCLQSVNLFPYSRIHTYIATDKETIKVCNYLLGVAVEEMLLALSDDSSSGVVVAMASDLCCAHTNTQANTAIHII